MDTILTLHREAQRQCGRIKICWKAICVQYVKIGEFNLTDCALCLWECTRDGYRFVREAEYSVRQEYIILGEGADRNLSSICDGRNPWWLHPSKAVIRHAVVLEREEYHLLTAECLTDIAVNGDVAHSTRDDLNGFDRSYLDNAHHELFPTPILIS